MTARLQSYCRRLVLRHVAVFTGPGTRVVFLLVAIALFLTRLASAELAFQQLCAFPTSAPGPWHPATCLAEAADANFYGTTARGGLSDWGTLFKVSPSGTLTTLLSFIGSNGQYPAGGLVTGRDGNFYGATAGTGVTNFGTIFRVTPGGALTTLFSFQGTNGITPYGRLIQADNGNFYGTTRNGGAFGLGTAFGVSTNGVITMLVSFAGTNGCNPSSGLVMGGNGLLYGTTQFGGSNYIGANTGLGTVYSLTTNGLLTTLVYFNQTNGSQPRAALAQGSDGNFYGTASSGGTNNLGTVFRLTPSGLLTTLLDFGPTGGVRPFGGVTEGGDGAFYGTTSYRFAGSVLTNGTVFKLTTNGVMTTLVNLDGTNGIHPFTDLTQASDGNLYGAMADANLSHSTVNGGTIYRLAQRPVIASLVSSNGTNTVSWSAFANGIYQIERSGSVSSPSWTPRPPAVNAGGSTASFAEPKPGSVECYYRVVLLP